MTPYNNSEKKKKYHREYYSKNKEKMNATKRRNYAKDPGPQRVRSREYRANHIEETHTAYRLYRQKFRSAFFMIYGNECACCHEKNVKFLTVGHIFGDGAVDRIQNGGEFGTLRRAVKYPDLMKYETQCFNCNLGNYHNRGICPHKQEKDVDKNNCKSLEIQLEEWLP